MPLHSVRHQTSRAPQRPAAQAGRFGFSRDFWANRWAGPSQSYTDCRVRRGSARRAHSTISAEYCAQKQPCNSVWEPAPPADHWQHAHDEDRTSLIQRANRRTRT